MVMGWYQEIVRKWVSGIAHTFILHGNVGDTVTVNGTHRIKDVLIASDLCAKRDIVILYDRSSGITFPLPSHKAAFMTQLGFDEEDMLPNDPVGALRIIEEALLATKKSPNNGTMPVTAVIISYAEAIASANDVSSMSGEDRTVLVTLQRWAREAIFSNVGSPIFLITENISDINSMLRCASSRVEAIKISLPNMEERIEYIQVKCAGRGVHVPEIHRAAAMTAGLSRMHIDDIILRAQLEESSLTADLIRSRKDEIVRQEFGEILELNDPENDFDILGGMEHAIGYLKRNIANPIKVGNLRRVPMGVLLTGPPGTGKTVLAECLAKDTGVNCAKLNLSKIFDSLVGSSERNLEKALMCLEALEPVLVVVDEIDQSGLSRDSGGDSGVSNRLFKRLLEFMSDTRHRGKIIWIGISNRPDLLDAALKRPGRFDRKLPILPPDAKGRQEIFKVMLAKYSIAHNIDLALVAEKTDGYTGAEIEALVLKSLEVSEDDNSPVIEEKHLAYALEAYIPSTQSIQKMTQLALAECNDKDLVPPHYRHVLDERKKETINTEAPAARSLREL